MNNRIKTVMTAAALATSLACSASAEADETHCYTLASLNGTYAIVGSYTGSIALALGVRHYDGQGNFAGTFTLNEPDPASTTGGRKIVTGTQVGTYTVNCDGTGTTTRTLTSSTGVVTVQHDDVLITQAKPQDDGQLLATALADAQRVPSAIVAGGVFLFRSYTRRPD